MKLRIVSGVLRGRYLTIPERDCDFRPTRERVRESVANILSPRLRGAKVADICAGSGGMGFEFISRGAAKATFVECDRFRCRQIAEHAGRFGIDGQCLVVAKEIAAFVRSCTEHFDIVYFDPPYDAGWVEPLLPALMCLLGAGGLLVCERRSSKVSCTIAAPDGILIEPFDRRTYGETEICFYTTT